MAECSNTEMSKGEFPTAQHSAAHLTTELTSFPGG